MYDHITESREEINCWNSHR